MLERLLEERCPACAGPTRAGFCTLCAAACPVLEPGCPRCGLPRPVERCPRERGPWWLERIVAPYVYRDPLKTHILDLKYRGRRHLGRALGLLAADALATHAAPLDALVPTPLHGARWRERGYNQAIEIARPIAQRFGLPVLVHGIRRRRATPPQAELAAGERRRNLAGAFAISRSVAARRLCIVDDVVTTGATTNALACALLNAGAASVIAFAPARTLE